MTEFVRDSLASDHPIQVMVTPDKIDLLRDSLGGDAKRVRFADMAEIGRNPSRIIPAWQEFFDEAGGRYARGIGEPIWASRSPEELVESQRHEALINIAFRRAQGWILCPYDVDALGPDVIDEAHRSHPTMVDGSRTRASEHYLDIDAISRPFDAPLAEPPASWDGMNFARGGLDAVRTWAHRRASAFGFGEDRVTEAVLAVSELAANSLRHGGGSGSLRSWAHDASLVFEVRDHGHIAWPLVGRVRPEATNENGFGLWIVNQLCDLVQVRTFQTGTTVRVYMARR